MIHCAILKGRGDFAEWRNRARAFLVAGIEPQAIDWQDASMEAGLFGSEETPLPSPAEGVAIPVPATFIDLATAVVCHSDPARFDLLYRLLWRLARERELLQVRADEEVARARLMEKSVRRDSHKMTAFVRFREIGSTETARRSFVAWFEPDHHIVARTAPFFQRRFNDMDWVIATPRGTAAWDGDRLTLSDEPADKPEISDDADELWRTYYANIFNPARLKVKAMQAEMPKKYWKNLPEASLIPGLIADAEARVLAMAKRQASEPLAFHDRLQAAARAAPAEPLPPAGTLEALRIEARGCTRCPLHCKATQTVFGEGPDHAEVMFVGEQPGDQEDLAGRPFVGPAGKVFDMAITEAGIDRRRLYVTNAVKHFKYEPRGKRRIHQKPNMGEVEQCRWWLAREIDLIRPKLVVALGTTAYAALTDGREKLADVRGRVIPLGTNRLLFVTVHPSYLLRIPDARKSQEENRRFVADLAAVRDAMRDLPSSQEKSMAG